MHLLSSRDSHWYRPDAFLSCLLSVCGCARTPAWVGGVCVHAERLGKTKVQSRGREKQRAGALWEEKTELHLNSILATHWLQDLDQAA